MSKKVIELFKKQKPYTTYELLYNPPNDMDRLREQCIKANDLSQVIGLWLNLSDLAEKQGSQAELRAMIEKSFKAYRGDA